MRRCSGPAASAARSTSGCPMSWGGARSSTVHARDKPLGEDVDLDHLARKTLRLLRRAAGRPAQRGRDHGRPPRPATAISSEDLHAGWLKVAVGTSRRRSMDERERVDHRRPRGGPRRSAASIHGDTRRVEEISLFAHGEALGVTVSSQEDNDLPAESDLRARLVALMGGRAAEELLFHEVTGGASNDFEKANQIANLMVTKWGMGRDPETKDAGTSGRGVAVVPRTPPAARCRSEVQGRHDPRHRAHPRRGLRRGPPDAPRAHRHRSPDLGLPGGAERIDGDTFDALFDGTLEVPQNDVEWRPAASRPRDWAEIAVDHGNRRHARPFLTHRACYAHQGPRCRTTIPTATPTIPTRTTADPTTPAPGVASECEPDAREGSQAA